MMKTNLISTIYGLAILVGVIMFVVFPVQAEVWTSGHYEIFDGDAYWELEIYNDVTLDIFGGEIGSLWTFDVTKTNWYAGEAVYLLARDNSIVNIYGCNITFLGVIDSGTVNLHNGYIENGFSASENGILNLYAYDVIYHPTGGSWYDEWIEGKYLSNDLHFDFDIAPGDISHINIVPEPASILLLSVGGLLLRKK